MSFMKRLFGGAAGDGASGPSKVSATTANKTIQTIGALKEQEENLEKRKALLEKRAEDELQKARVFNKAGKKPQALMCLKRKKLLEQAMENMENMLMRLIEQRNALENQTATAEVMASMYQANKQQKDIMKQMKIENVDAVIDDIKETQSQMQQVHEAMGQSAVDMDEDDLMNELENLEAEELDAQLLEPAPVPTKKVPSAKVPDAKVPDAQVPAENLPTAPATKASKPKAKTPEEEELEALQAEMAL